MTVADERQEVGKIGRRAEALDSSSGAANILSCDKRTLEKSKSKYVHVVYILSVRVFDTIRYVRAFRAFDILCSLKKRV